MTNVGKRVVRVVLYSVLLTCAATRLASANSTTDLFQGTFSADDQVELFSITVGATEDVTIESYGYGGGAVNAITIPSGGFAPDVFLFDPTGNEIASDSGGYCGLTATDPMTGNCDDSLLDDTLSAGTYTLALAELGNYPNDSSLADGFVEDGDPGFTCAAYGLTGNFCDESTALGTQRTGDYALAITGADAAADLSNPTTVTPEPSTFSLFFAGIILWALLYQMRRRESFLARELRD